MNIRSLKETDPKQLLKQALYVYNDHSVTVLFIIAGGLIGFSLLRVQSLADVASSSASGEVVVVDEEAGDLAEEPVELQTIKLDQDTLDRLDSIKDDTDVIIDSNLPDNRINPF